MRQDADDRFFKYLKGLAHMQMIDCASTCWRWPPMSLNLRRTPSDGHAYAPTGNSRTQIMLLRSIFQEQFPWVKAHGSGCFYLGIWGKYKCVKGNDSEMEDGMTTYVHIRLRLKSSEAMKTKKSERQSRCRLARFNDFMAKFVMYHRDERLRQKGSPFIWTE